jgi:hypothetical protein
MIKELENVRQDEEREKYSKSVGRKTLKGNGNWNGN